MPRLENKHALLAPLTLENYSHLEVISQEKNLIHYSPSTISTPESLRAYVEVALKGYEEQTAIPFIIYDKVKQQYAGSTRFGLIN